MYHKPSTIKPKVPLPTKPKVPLPKVPLPCKTGKLDTDNEHSPISMAIFLPILVQRTPLRTIVRVLQREIQITRT